MDLIVDKIATLWPEIAMLVGAVVCLFTGLAPSAAARRLTAGIAAATLVVAGVLVVLVGPVDATGLGLGGFTAYVKLSVVLVGLILLMVAANLPESLRQVRDAENAPAFDPERATRGEFFGFFLASLTGVMLVAGAGDLVWLFLALELVSLPTYVMVATGRERIDAQEAGVKYFFLGALSVAFFLYGFALIYGATGFTQFVVRDEAGAVVGGIVPFVQERLAAGAMPDLLLVGIILSVVGIAFKTASVPMHGYVADVYQGAATPVTTFLAFVPKAAGFIAIILLLGIVGWPLDKTPGVADGGDALVWVLWLIAALTMTVGNVLALLQDNVKRALAYSSVAHSGYLFVGVLAGRSAGGPLNDGLAAVLFYLLAYGLSTVAAFAALGCLRARGEEAQTYDDLSGLAKRHPILAAILAVASLSLLGVPPLVGFLGKIYLFAPAISQGFVVLVVIAVINSAISAGYYLRIASTCFFGEERHRVEELDVPLRRIAAAVAAIAAIVLGFIGGILAAPAHDATRPLAATGTPAAIVDVIVPR